LIYFSSAPEGEEEEEEEEEEKKTYAILNEIQKKQK
jgi:hypothetical protein